MSIDLPSEGTARGGVGIGWHRRLATILLFLLAIWIVYLVDWMFFHGTLVNFGVVPRSVHGLLGILFMPFLHGSWSHLWGNSLGIIFLGGLLILWSEESFWAVSIIGALASGLGTWLIGRGNSVHIGASGVIFAYFGFLLFSGIFERRIGTLLLSALVFFVWGGMVWSILPTHGGYISWEGHLCGLAGGMLTAKMLAKAKPTGREAIMGSGRV